MSSSDPQNISAVLKHIRELLAEIADSAILTLDAIDSDPDLEPNADYEAEPDDEPSLGSTNGMDQTQSWKVPSSVRWDVDLEHEHDGRERDERL